MQKGENTRSGLLWEVERLLDECTDLPQVLLMENVPDVIGTKNMPSFADWIKKLEILGYKNYWQNLKATDFGIPQSRNRTFMISLLGDYYYSFPKPIKLKYLLKDFLESEVAEKYYLSDKVIEKIKFEKEIKIYEKTGIDLNSQKSELRDICSTIKSRYDCGYENYKPGPTGVIESMKVVANTNPSRNGMNGNVYSGDISTTLTTNKGKGIKIVEPKLLQVGNLDIKGNDSIKRVYSPNGLCPTLTTMEGGNRQPKIVKQNLKQELANELIKSGRVKEFDMIRHSYSNNRMEYKRKLAESNNISPTLDTRCDCLGVVEPICLNSKVDGKQPSLQDRVYDSSAVSTAITTSFHPSYRVSKDKTYFWNYQESNEFQKEPLENMARTLKASKHDASVIHNLRIRKLSPTECWRLMGFRDKLFDKAQTVNSNSQLYKQAGNSIVTTVLMAIFGELLDIEWQSKVKNLINDIKED